jgi:hypothetical protein
LYSQYHQRETTTTDKEMASTTESKSGVISSTMTPTSTSVKHFTGRTAPIAPTTTPAESELSAFAPAYVPSPALLEKAKQQEASKLSAFAPAYVPSPALLEKAKQQEASLMKSAPIKPVATEPQTALHGLFMLEKKLMDIESTRDPAKFENALFEFFTIGESPVDRMNIAKTMNDIQQTQMVQFYRDNVQSQLNYLFNAIRPKLQLIAELRKQIKRNQKSAMMGPDVQIQQSLFGLMSESEKNMETYLKEHQKNRNLLFSKIFGIPVKTY